MKRFQTQYGKLIGTLVLVTALAVGLGMGFTNQTASESQAPLTVNYTALTTDYDLTSTDGQATIIIHAPEVGEVGELVRFDVSESVAESFRWLVVPETGDFEVYNDGKNAVFSARRPGEYMFIVACAFKGTVDVATHVITIQGQEPLPPDDNKPTPEVPEPEEGSSLDTWVTYWCASLQLPKHEARQLAESFESVAAMISADVGLKPQDIIEATSKANRAALGDSIDQWVPLLQQLQGALQKQAEEGNLVTVDQHTEVWRLVATGLNNYASL